MRLTRRELFIGAAGSLGAPMLFAAPDGAWQKSTFRELHLDAHFGQLPAPYEGFDAESAARILKDARFQMVSFFAQCNAGYCYYPTELGVMHPGLKRDYTGQMTAALRKQGIRVLAYVSAGPDRRFHKDHPECAIVRNPPSPTRGDMAQMCLNSPFVEQAHIPLLKEIASKYAVDGFFLDNLLGKFVGAACYCKYCREAFAADVGGEIPVSESDPKVFAHHRWLAYRMGRYAERVTAALGGMAFVFTHLWVTRTPVSPPPAVTQLVWEPVPPYPGVHSLDFSLEARYLSTLRGIDNFSCMATRGNGWGDYSLRDPAAFRHEAAVLLASGGRPYLSDDSYPSGNPDPAVYRVYGEVNRRTAELEPIVQGCVPVKDTAVLLSADSIWSTLPLTPARDWMGGPASIPVAGAHKALTEEHVQFSILNSEVLAETLADYHALVLPEQCILNEKECDAIRRFVRQGGALIATGDTGTRGSANHALANFSLADVLGVRSMGPSEARRGYLRVPTVRFGAADIPLADARGSDPSHDREGVVSRKREIGDFGIPQMDVQIRSAYQRVQLTTAKTLLEIVPPVGPKQAPAQTAEGPGITINQFGQGNAIYCASALFAAYHQEGTPVLRRLASWMLSLVHPPARRAILLDNAPLNVEVVYNSRGAQRFVHLLNYTGDKRMSGAPRLQDVSVVQGIHVRCKCAAKPKSVLLVPERIPIPFEWKDGWASFQAQLLAVHSVYMMEG